MYPIFVMSGFMSQLDSLGYKIYARTDIGSVRVCEENDYLVISCLIVKIVDAYVWWT